MIAPELDRRAALGIALGAAASTIPPLATARPARAQVTTDLVTRLIPKTGERVPALGLGTFMTFDLASGQKRDNQRDVLRIYWQAGGRVIDTSPVYGNAEVIMGDLAYALAIADQAFWANKIWSTGDFLGDATHAEQSYNRSRERLWREDIELMQCHSLVNADVIVPLLAAWRKEGRVKHVGVSTHEPLQFPAIMQWIEHGAVDFVQVRYSIFMRAAEERLIPLARDRGVAVLANMPLEKARLHKVVEGRRLPDFARELRIETWSQFFLKWVISNPAVTCALHTTANPAHMAENVGAMRGPLPDARMREQMVRHMETLPSFADIDRDGARSWYPGKTYAGLVGRALAEQRART
jgi:diketogulonate reductase-like aldo/keto reductase